MIAGRGSRARDTSFLTVKQPLVFSLVVGVFEPIAYQPELATARSFGRWSTNGLPDGLVCNSNTGTITGLLGETGKYPIEIAYAEPGVQDSMYLVIYVLESTETWTNTLKIE